MRLRQSTQDDLWQQIRRRILSETSSFLSRGVQRPELGVSIPVIQAGKGRFTRTFSDAFWSRILDE